MPSRPVSYAFAALTGLTELGDFVVSLARRLVRRQLTVGVDPPRGQLDFDRYLVLCVYETHPRPDIAGLIRRFKEAGFGVVLATSNDAYKQYIAAADAVIRVAAVGRDFTAYKEGYKYLAEGRRPNAVVFANDSVWYFENQQAEVVARIAASLDRGALVAGTMILDYVPHVAGWLFGVPWHNQTDGELATLFAPSFVRKSRRYHIRRGEHRIMHVFQSVSDIVSLDEDSPAPAVANGYHALMLGRPCFYVKADAILRTNPLEARLTEFIERNAIEAERRPVLRWLAGRSDGLLGSWLRARELRMFQQRYFPGTDARDETSRSRVRTATAP